MTLELNVFNVCNKPSVDTKMHEVNQNEEVRKKDNIISLCISDSLEMALVIDMQLIEKFNLHDINQFIDYPNNNQCLYTVGERKVSKSYLIAEEIGFVLE